MIGMGENGNAGNMNNGGVNVGAMNQMSYMAATNQRTDPQSVGNLEQTGPLVMGPGARRDTMGGMGLRSAVRSAPAAYWSSMVNILNSLHAKLPLIANRLIHDLESGGNLRDFGSAKE